MVNTIIKLLITFAVLTAMPSLFASPPDWSKEKPKDPKYKYYVGRSSLSASEATSYTEAVHDAIYQAIRDNYGFSSQISLSSYETEDRATLVQRVNELSKNIKFEDFEQVESFAEPAKDNRFNAWVLFRYSKAAIAKEKFRLKTATANDAKLDYSKVGSIADSAKGSLTVISDPIGASVFVDGNQWGVTPVKLIGKLTSGVHTIRLEHPDYETAEEQIIFTPGSNRVFRRVLIKGSGTVRVETEPPAAAIFLDGQYIGSSPTDFLTVTSSERHSIKITHAETETYSQEFTVVHDDQRLIKINLPLKPAILSVSVTPKDAEILLDGSSIKASQPVPPGTHKLVVRKNLYLPYEQEVTVRGGQKLVLPAITLKSYSVALRWAKYTLDNPLNLAIGYGGFFLGLNNGLDIGSPYGANASIEKQFFGRFGIKAIYRFIAHPITKKVRKYPEQERPKDNTKEDATVGTISGHIVDIGIPFYFGNGYVSDENTKKDIPNTRGNFYLMPVYSFATGKYRITKSDLVTDVESTGEFNTRGYGGEVGYYWQSSSFNWRILVGLTRYSGGDSNKVTPKSLCNLGLELGWTIGGIDPEGINQMEKQLNEENEK